MIKEVEYTKKEIKKMNIIKYKKNYVERSATNKKCGNCKFYHAGDTYSCCLRLTHIIKIGVRVLSLGGCDDYTND